VQETEHTDSKRSRVTPNTEKGVKRSREKNNKKKSLFQKMVSQLLGTGRAFSVLVSLIGAYFALLALKIVVVPQIIADFLIANPQIDNITFFYFLGFGLVLLGYYFYNKLE